jgi:hypothetical protein
MPVWFSITPSTMFSTGLPKQPERERARTPAVAMTASERMGVPFCRGTHATRGSADDA